MGQGGPRRKHQGGLKLPALSADVLPPLRGEFEFSFVLALARLFMGLDNMGYQMPANRVQA